jgi:hypothetical protein
MAPNFSKASYKASYKAYKSAPTEVKEFKLRKEHNERFFDGEYDDGHAWWMLKLSADSDPLCRMHKRRLQKRLGIERPKQTIPLELLTSGRVLKAIARNAN